MLDPCQSQLLDLLRLSEGQSLWLADEHHHAVLTQIAQLQQPLTLISNRYDVIEKADALGIRSHFNDWNLSVGDGPWQSIFLRVCKERSVTHHLLNQAHEQLPLGGKLYLAGQKNEGIKSYFDKARGLFSDTTRLHKNSNNYHACLTKRQTTAAIQLETNDYTRTRVIAQWDDKPIMSKPGVYGWEKIDAGSELLVEQAKKWWQHNQVPCDRLLDLGCGYGYLTLATGFLPCSQRVATDNNAGAIACAQKNADLHRLNVEVVPSDCADTIKGPFDLILCNPPFHKGFDTEHDLTEQFLRAAKDKLAGDGTALFVTNSFIPIEKKAEAFFRRVQRLENNKQFKVVLLQP